MSFSSYFFSLLVLVQLQTTFVLGTDPLYYICDAAKAPETYSPYGAYATNLETVFSDLYHKAAHKNSGNGFLGSASGVGNDRAYGQALCRGDASPNNCQLCISNATSVVRDLCGFNRSVVVWYDFCSLKFSSHDFFGKLDVHNNFTMVNVMKLTDSHSFMKLTASFLEQLSEGAATDVTRYAAGKKGLCEYLTLYGMAQCTGDIPREDCTSCLKTGIAELPKENRQGARWVSGSCNVRYEIYPFLGNYASN